MGATIFTGPFSSPAAFRRDRRDLGSCNSTGAPTWQDARIRDAAAAPDTLWTTHQVLKRELLDEVALRTGVRLDTDVLTIGFARRAAGYKRSDLVFHDPTGATELAKV